MRASLLGGFLAGFLWAVGAEILMLSMPALLAWTAILFCTAVLVFRRRDV